MKTDVTNFPKRKYAVIAGMNVGEKSRDDDEVDAWLENFTAEVNAVIKDLQRTRNQAKEPLIKTGAAWAISYLKEVLGKHTEINVYR